MKRAFKILLFLFTLLSITYSQSTDIKKFYNNDSIKVNYPKNPLTDILFKFDEFELHLEFNNMKMNVSIDGNPETVWLRTSLVVSNTDNAYQNFSPHFLSPLERKYYEDSKFDPVKYVLGMVQTGAVGYLAYKHIKKYGFFK